MMKKFILFLYDFLAGLSPYIEVKLRQLYWENSSKLKKNKPLKNIKLKNDTKIDFSEIINYLKKSGVKDGSLLIVHSAYDVLENTGLSADEIVNELIKLVGHNGTLAMPVIRHFKGEPKYDEILTANIEDTLFEYNVEKSVVITGFLPYSLMKCKNSFTSRFPLNPMTAVGLLAEEMMRKNLDGDFPTPHGINSSWNFCLNNNAIVLGLGIDLVHYLTILHVAEEAFDDWPISKEDWYRKRKFKIIDGDDSIEKNVYERKPKWGMLNLAETKLKKDIFKNKLLKFIEIDGVHVSLVNSKEYISFLRKNNKKGYPYYF